MAVIEDKLLKRKTVCVKHFFLTFRTSRNGDLTWWKWYVLAVKVKLKKKKKKKLI